MERKLRDALAEYGKPLARTLERLRSDDQSVLTWEEFAKARKNLMRLRGIPIPQNEEGTAVGKHIDALAARFEPYAVAMFQMETATRFAAYTGGAPAPVGPARKTAGGRKAAKAPATAPAAKPEAPPKPAAAKPEAPPKPAAAKPTPERRPPEKKSPAPSWPKDIPDHYGVLGLRLNATYSSIRDTCKALKKKWEQDLARSALVTSACDALLDEDAAAEYRALLVQRGLDDRVVRRDSVQVQREYQLAGIFNRRHKQPEPTDYESCVRTAGGGPSAIGYCRHWLGL